MKAVNISTTNTTISAYYTSGNDDLPGKMRFENNSIAGALFNFDWSAAGASNTAFNPKLETTGIDSDNEDKDNRVYISKKGEPEAVPILNYVDIGSEEFPIERIIGLRDSVFVFKKDGVYRILGEDASSFVVRLFDNTAIIKGNESAIVFNNYIVCMTLLGICSVSDNGVSVLSMDIEDKILPLFAESKHPDFEDLTFGVAYDSQKYFAMFTVKTEGVSQQVEQAFIYNSFTRAWTRWEMNRTCGAVNITDDLLYLGGVDNFIYVERKNLDRTDYADEDYDVTITNVNNLIITLSSLTNVTVGQSILQGDNFARIVSIDAGAVTVTLDEIIVLVNGAATVNDPILTTVKWLPQYTQNPAMVKLFQEVTFIFRALSANITAQFKSNYSTLPEFIEITPYVSATEGTWGSGAWGVTYPWGGGSLDEGKTVRTFFPREKMRAQWASIQITTNEAFSLYELAGISIGYSDMSTRMK